MDFITLTDTNGVRARVAKANIAAYFPSGEQTIVMLANGVNISVTDKAADIDAALTPAIIAASPATLEASNV